MSIIMAIDPGKNGGFAYQVGGKTFVEKLPSDRWDIYAMLSDMNMEEHKVTMYLEDVGYHQFGNNASSSCKFARHCGHIEMALTALRIKTVVVRPTKWMSTMGTLPSGKAKVKERKAKIREYMQSLYPEIGRIYLWGADALGILTYGLKQEGVR